MNLIKTDLMPLDTCCLVQVEKPFSDKKNPEQKIFVPESIRDSEAHSIDEGWIVKKGINAFQDILDEEFKPKIGEKVKFVRHAGRFLKELAENEDYVLRVVKDTDIFAVERGIANE